MKPAVWSIVTFLLAYSTALGAVALAAQAVPTEWAVLVAFLAMFGVMGLSARRHGLPLRWSSGLARGFVYGGIFVATGLSWHLRWDAREQWGLLTVLVTFPILLSAWLIAWEVDRRRGKRL